MIRKLKRKFVAVVMAIVFLSLVFIFASMYWTNRTALEQSGLESLRAALTQVNLPKTAADSSADSGQAALPAELPPENTGGKQPRNDRTPFVVVSVASDGSVTILQNQIDSLTDQEITEAAALAMDSDRENGLLSDYSLRYLKSSTPGATKIAFSDTYLEQSTLRSQLIHSVLIGAAALAGFFIASLLLAGWMVRPIARAWAQQQQFVADASHELKTPLTVVLSNADLLLAAHPDADEKSLRRLDNIRAESARMKGLVEDLLTLARIEEAEAPPLRNKADWSYLVTGGILTLEPVVYDSGRSLEYEVDPDLFVLGNGAHLRQLTDILLDNAVKYGDAGSVIRVSLHSDGKHAARLSVTSTGTPIPQADLPRIFERFYRQDKARSSGGYGLGLAIASGIVREHSGKIWAQSDEEARQNTFCVRLPLYDGSKPAS